MMSADERPLAVFVAWKDICHPAAGGAEVVHQEWSKRLIADGYRVIHLVPGFAGCSEHEVVNGVEIQRFGKSVLSFYSAARYYREQLSGEADLLIDVFNCFGSFALRAGAKGRAAFMIHHIQDRMWFYQTSFPGVPRLLMPFINVAGYVLEKLQLLLLARLHRGPVVTVSGSTADELAHYGFGRELTSISHNGCPIRPLESLEDSRSKFKQFTVLLIGPRKSKRPMQTLRAFEQFQKQVPDSSLRVVGWGTETPKMTAYSRRRGLQNVVFEGRVSEQRKCELLQRCHVLCTTPVKEGWGLIVNEANAMGTPALGYHVAGLRDALDFGNGWLCVPTPAAMAKQLLSIFSQWQSDPEAYEALRERCLETSKQWSFDRSYAELMDAVRRG